MRGFEVEWCPGTDHAAIATQNVIERQLEEEGTTKEELGREAFQARVDAWYEEYGGRIYEQMRRMGYTCDWERSRFTLDDAYVRAIRLVFKTLFDEGLVYRGPRIVNWCPRCQSAISDEEIDWQEHTDTLYYLTYPVEGGAQIVARQRAERPQLEQADCLSLAAQFVNDVLHGSAGGTEADDHVLCTGERVRLDRVIAPSRVRVELCRDLLEHA